MSEISQEHECNLYEHLFGDEEGKTMSEKKGPFDAAIRRISVLVNDHGDGTDAWVWDTIRPVLEAAGKVDILSAQYFVDGAGNYGEGLAVVKSDSSRYLYQAGEQAVRALLESLPDEEKEGK